MNGDQFSVREDVEEVTVSGSYTSLDVQQLAGISYRQLDYWARLGLLRWVGYVDAPVNTAGTTGSGVPRRFPASEVRVAAAIPPSSEVAARIAATVRRNGLSGIIVHGERDCWRLLLDLIPDPLAIV